ncbi:PREDICTED: zinc finger BED domain-containing protein 1-like [Wasmannia auropunctata]|uniref:zinc finger BED domain-containing protein 1-like n=1 Tax=Wasmannia auropunctata TaxID=64793 RepID=UPI0005F09010|nr:PREDICTED: zinc finger BED domain-containing protein 1-like [Wasmannia auropunctata]
MDDSIDIDDPSIVQSSEKAENSMQTEAVIPNQSTASVQKQRFKNAKTSKSYGNHSIQPRIDRSLEKIKSFEVGGKKEAQLINAITFMIAKDNLPLNTVDKEGFAYFCKIACPLFKLPGRKQITNAIKSKYEILSTIIKQKISTAKNVTITADVWTETMNTVSFLGLTAHFLYNEELDSVTIGVFKLDERHTSEYLSAKMKMICDDWLIDLSNVHAVVTDNASNITAAVRDLFGKNKQLPCFAHTVNLVPAKLCEKVSDLKDIIDKVKAIVTFFKHSVVAADEFRNAQNLNASNAPLKLIQEVSTRWSSLYYMLERFVLLSDPVSSVMLKFKKSPPMLSGFELAILQEVLKLLKPFEVITKEISGQKFVTCSKVIPMIHCLRNQLTELKPESDVSKKLKNYLLSKVENRFQSIEKQNLLAFATILYPRFKKIHFRDALACSSVLLKINNMLRELNVEKNASDIENEPNVDSAIEESSLWNFHYDLVNKSKTQLSCNEESFLHIDLQYYFSQNVLPLNADPIKFWISQKNSAPNLSFIALKYLSAVTTSVPSERMFSCTGNIMSDNRNRITGEHLTELLFLRSLKFSDWQLALE